MTFWGKEKFLNGHDHTVEHEVHNHDHDTPEHHTHIPHESPASMGRIAAMQDAQSRSRRWFLGLGAAETGCSTSFYAAHRFESQGGRRLADCIQQHVPPVIGAEPKPPVGMALPVLRETKMPAVLCELGPPPTVVSQGATLACAFAKALECWVTALDEV